MPRKQPAAPEQYAVVEVTWLDAAFDLDKVPDLMTLRTYGYLIRHDNDVVVVASEGDLPGKYFRSYTAIPAGWVQSIRPLQPAA